MLIKPIANWVRKPKTRILTSFLIGLLWLNVLVINDAFAETLAAQNIEVDSKTIKTQEIEQIAKESSDTFQRLIDKIQSTFETILTEINQTISDLPQQLEQAATETDATIGNQIKKAIGNKQTTLDNAADAVNDLAEKLQMYSRRLELSVQESQIAISNEFQNNVQNAQESLKNAAQTLQNLADDTKQAKKNTTPALRSLISEEIQALNQDLGEVTKSIKVFEQNPA